MKVLRVYHAGRDAAHRRRDAALAAAGVDVHLVVPDTWPDHGSEDVLREQRFPVTELAVQRAGDVNRHRYADRRQLTAVLDRVGPDVLDLHEEPFSLAARQWLAAAGSGLPVVMYSAQNLDKRYPPPFHQYEQAALHRASGFYPCSRQAASVLRGKGFGGRVEVLPLGVPSDGLAPGEQAASTSPFRLALVGRLVPEKGALDAVRVLAAVHTVTPARLALVGAGPDLQPALRLADALGVRDRVDYQGWVDADGIAALYRSAHVVLVPSRATSTWVEQFGRVIVEARAAGAVVAGYASGAIPEVAGEAGVLVPEGRVVELADAVMQLAGDRGYWEVLREKGIAASTEFTWDTVAARQLRLYTDVLGAAAPTGRRRPARAVHRTHRRQQARAEFGPPAEGPAGSRPFALPYLREPRLASRLTARLLDAI